MFNYIWVVETGQVRVITIKVKLYWVPGCAVDLNKSHFYKRIYPYIMCKTMSAYKFKRKKGRREEYRKGKVVKKNKLLMVLNTDEEKEYKQLIRIF